VSWRGAPLCFCPPWNSFADAFAVTCVVTDTAFGLESIVCKEAAFETVYTSAGLVLRSIQEWLFDAAISSLPEVRDLALQALQKLLLASGSLCGLLQLATCLVLNGRVSSPEMTTGTDKQTWERLDLLSEDGQSSAQSFVAELSASVQRIVVGNNSKVDQKSLLDKPGVERLFLLQEEINGAEGNPSDKVRKHTQSVQGDIMLRKVDALQHTSDVGSSASLVTLLVAPRLCKLHQAQIAGILLAHLRNCFVIVR
jgi:hypothetical protein